MDNIVEIMNAKDLDRAITRIAHEIIERNKGVRGIALAGICRRGVPIAKRLAEKFYEIEGILVPVGSLDITLYRDDLSLLCEHPVVSSTDFLFSVNNQRIIIVDDVIYTGRTVRAAIDAIFDLGRPASIQLAVIIDRGHRELPFKADYVGKNLPTSKSEVVHVNVREIDGEDSVILTKTN